MPSFHASGPLPRALLAHLEAAGWKPGPTGPQVVWTARAELPSAARQPGWVWVCGEAPTSAVASAAVDRGAVDVVTAVKGFEVRVLARLTESLAPAPEVPTPRDFAGKSEAARALLRRLFQAAQTSMPVLLTGETGTGKELASRLIHQWSVRRAKSFVPVNCAAIPNELMEGELFGYVRGAFSGATRDYDGQLAAGEGGTVFLDEIDDTPVALQNKLLRVLEDRVISRLGEPTGHQVDFRLVAATNRDLTGLIEKGQFGADFYERLSTVQVVLPPLRERLEDVPLLLTQLFERFYREDPLAAQRHRVAACTPEALEVLRAYPWPGNIRELRNVVFGALVNKRTGQELLVSDLPRRLWARAPAGEGLVSAEAVAARLAAGTMNLKAELERLERLALEAALRQAGGNAAEAARLLGEVGRGAAKDPGGTVRTMMRRLGLTGA
jgi:transcriptional regulator with GAF, ATPase, and Fis domain